MALEQGCDRLAACMLWGKAEELSLSTPRVVGSYGEIRARILSRLLGEHEKEATTPHEGSQAFEAPGDKLLTHHLG